MSYAETLRGMNVAGSVSSNVPGRSVYCFWYCCVNVVVHAPACHVSEAKWRQRTITPPVLLLAVSSAVVYERSGFCVLYFDRYVPLPASVKRPYGVAPVENFRSTSQPLRSVRPRLMLVWSISMIGPGRPPAGVPRVMSDAYLT